MLDLTDLYKEIMEGENTSLENHILKEVSEPNEDAKKVLKKRTKVIINPPLKETALKIIKSRISE